MPTFPKEAIAEILQNLDNTKDELWTDDGSPLVSEIQRLANDKTITRAQINEAMPGFARKTGGTAPGPIETAKNTTIAPASEVQAEDDGFLTPEEEHEKIRGIAQQRVRDAELALSEAKAHTTEAYRSEKQAEQRLTRALQQYSAKFPPMTEAANIKQHLARQQEVLRERITGSRFEPNVATNPIDTTMMDRKRNNGRNGKGQAPAPFLPRKASVSY